MLFCNWAFNKSISVVDKKSHLCEYTQWRSEFDYGEVFIGWYKFGSLIATQLDDYFTDDESEKRFVVNRQYMCYFQGRRVSFSNDEVDKPVMDLKSSKTPKQKIDEHPSNDIIYAYYY